VIAGVYLEHPHGVQFLSLDTGGVDATQRGSPKPRQDVSVCKSDLSKGDAMNLDEVAHVVVGT
jgi:hypothetical protein